MGASPLAINLVGGALKAGAQDVLAALERKDGDAYAWAARAMDAAVAALPPKDAKLYEKLAAFPEDASLPSEALRLLFGATAASTLTLLCERSLLRKTGPSTRPAEWKLPGGRREVARPSKLPRPTIRARRTH